MNRNADHATNRPRSTRSPGCQDELKRNREFAGERVSRPANYQLTKTLADLISGHIVGRGVAAARSRPAPAWSTRTRWLTKKHSPRRARAQRRDHVRDHGDVRRDPAPAAAGLDRRRRLRSAAPRPRNPLHENRKITLRIASSSSRRWTRARQGRARSSTSSRRRPRYTDGIALTWDARDGDADGTFDVLAGEITDLPIDWENGWIGAKAPTFTIELTCKPYWRGTETLTSTAPRARRRS
jgi:hypothetical protein